MTVFCSDVELVDSSAYAFLGKTYVSGKNIEASRMPATHKHRIGFPPERILSE